MAMVVVASVCYNSLSYLNVVLVMVILYNAHVFVCIIAIFKLAEDHLCMLFPRFIFC